MKSRIPSLVCAAVTLSINCFVAFRVIPTVKRYYLGTDIFVPLFTQLVFDCGPAVLMAAGLLSAYVMAMSESRPAFRRIREPLAILVMLIGMAAMGSLFLPHWKCGEIINLNARESVAPATAEAEPDVATP